MLWGDLGDVAKSCMLSVLCFASCLHLSSQHIHRCLHPCLPLEHLLWLLGMYVGGEGAHRQHWDIWAKESLQVGGRNITGKGQVPLWGLRLNGEPSSLALGSGLCSTAAPLLDFIYVRTPAWGGASVLCLDVGVMGSGKGLPHRDPFQHCSSWSWPCSVVSPLCPGGFEHGARPQQVSLTHLGWE